MPNLKTLELGEVSLPEGFFLALKTSASEARLESIKHSGGLDISAAASEAYAKSICTMPNLKTLELEEVSLPEGFFLALKILASEARLELIKYSGGLDISAAASEAYAKSICTMPNLKTLELGEVSLPEGFFLALKTSASEARLELIKHSGGLDISAAASEAYAKSICTMPNLKTLELENVNIADGFFLALKTSASEARLESIEHCGGPSISAAALQAYAQSISTMPNLRTLELKNVIIADNISVSLTTSASTFGLWTWESPLYGHDGSAQVLSLCQHEGSDISAATWQALVQFICAVSHLLTLERAYIGHHQAYSSPSRVEQRALSIELSATSVVGSRALAEIICTMPILKTLELADARITDDFYLALAESASGARLESLKHYKGPDISAAASEAYAKSVCTMPNLTNLELVDVDVTDDFYLALLESASGARLESLKHYEGPDISAAASEAYAKSVCTMPNLTNLELEEVSITDDFYIALAESASGARLDLMRHAGGPGISPAASEAYAKGICTMPNLQTLELRAAKIADDFFLALKTSASRARLESIRHSGGPGISPTASQAYAKSICTMPNLKTLELRAVNLTEHFFFTLSTSASVSRLQSLYHHGGSVMSAEALQAYVKSICAMPHFKALETAYIRPYKFRADSSPLKPGRVSLSITTTEGSANWGTASMAFAEMIYLPNLRLLVLHDVSMADDFFLSIAVSASGVNLQAMIHIRGSVISPAASQAYAKSICSMPRLQSLHLQDVKISDEFYFALDESSSGTRLKSMIHTGGPVISVAASQAYAKSICTMSHLHSLKITNVNIPDDFFVALKASASASRIQRLDLSGMSTSKSILHSILHLPCLNSLTVRHVKNELSTSHDGNTKQQSTPQVKTHEFRFLMFGG
ncbi:uncharacterized protein [Diadema antillarum]|uniref:uncharacterized protein n=1 Tax=Diadema antillarum TaxID=105358 RepID=UPI003A88E2BD